MATWTISSGGNFTTLQSANDSGSVNNGDTLAVDEANYICQSSALTISKQLTITTNGTFGVTTPTAAEATSKARCASNAATQVTINAANVLWERVAVCPGNNNNMVAFHVGDYAGVVIRRTGIFYTNVNAASCGGVSFDGTGGNTLTVYDVAYASSTSGSDVFASCRTNGGVVNVYHSSCFATSWYTTFRFDGGGSVYAYACVVQGGTSTLSSNTSFGDDIVSSNATGMGTNKRAGYTTAFNSTTGQAEDLTLPGAAGDLLSSVTDRSGTVAGLATDIAGTTRSAPIDPGTWQVPGASGGITCSMSGTGVIAAVLLGAAAMTSAMAGAGSMVATLSGAGAMTCAAAGAGSVSATLSGAAAIVSAMAGAGSLAATASGAAAMACAMAGAGSVSCTASAAGAMACGATGTGSMVANCQDAGLTICNMQGSGTLSATSSAAGAMICAMVGSGTMTCRITDGIPATSTTTIEHDPTPIFLRRNPTSQRVQQPVPRYNFGRGGGD